MNAALDKQLPVVIIGAGPIGLAAAAHLAEIAMPFLVFESGEGVGDHLAAVGHVSLFSPWRMSIDGASGRILGRSGWQAPSSEDIPSARDVVERYLQPLARVPELAVHVRLRSRVVGVSRAAHDKAKAGSRDASPFVVQVLQDGRITEYLARAVLDASGTWGTPNPLGAHGLPVPGEHEHAARIAYGMPDILGIERMRYAGRHVLVIGAGHSAAGNLLALASLRREVPGTRISWAVRGNDLARAFGRGGADRLSARAALGERLRELVDSREVDVHFGFRVHRLESTGTGILVVGDDVRSRPLASIDEIIASTGSRPDLSFTRELRLRLDEGLESPVGLAPLIDPNVHSCGTVRPHGFRELQQPEPGFFSIGAKSYGRAPNFLMATGYEQVRSVVAALAGDHAAANRVELELPTARQACAKPPLTKATQSSCAGKGAQPAQPTCTGAPAEGARAAGAVAETER